MSRHSALVGIYSGYGADTVSRYHLENFFKDLGFRTEKITCKELCHPERINKYSILAFPGGRADLMISAILPECIDNIRDYVRNGGAYMGICAGSYFASRITRWDSIDYGDDYGYVLSLYNGYATGPIKEIGDYNLMVLNNLSYPTNVTWFDGEVFNVTYWGGPYFEPVDNVDVVAVYDQINESAAIKFPYGQGRVLLFGFHPEIDLGYYPEGYEHMLDLLKTEIYWLAGVNMDTS